MGKEEHDVDASHCVGGLLRPERGLLSAAALRHIARKPTLQAQYLILVGMRFLIITLLLSAATTCSANAQTDIPPADTLSVHDRIKMDRAKDAAAMIKDANAPRPWDRDSGGKRPWETPVPVRPK